MVQLNQMLRGQTGRIIKIDSKKKSISRLAAMGFVPGTDVKVVGVAPLGDPIIVEVGTNQVSLRRDDASALAVERD